MPFKIRAGYAVAALLACLLCVSTSLCACNTAPTTEISLITRTPEFSGSIYINGTVNNPGIYPFKASDSLGDLITAAGGLQPGAAIAGVTFSFPETSAASLPQRIDINRAEAWLLAALPGIGDVSAQKIIAYREANGPFRSTEDLLKVHGIGPSTLDKIADFITVAG